MWEMKKNKARKNTVTVALDNTGSIIFWQTFQKTKTTLTCQPRRICHLHRRNINLCGWFRLMSLHLRRHKLEPFTCLDLLSRKTTRLDFLAQKIKPYWFKITPSDTWPCPALPKQLSDIFSVGWLIWYIIQDYLVITSWSSPGAIQEEFPYLQQIFFKKCRSVRYEV